MGGVDGRGDVARFDITPELFIERSTADGVAVVHSASGEMIVAVRERPFTHHVEGCSAFFCFGMMVFARMSGDCQRGE